MPSDPPLRGSALCSRFPMTLKSFSSARGLLYCLSKNSMGEEQAIAWVSSLDSMMLLEELGGYRGQLKTFVLKNNRHFMSWYIFISYCDHNLHALLSLSPWMWRQGLCPAGWRRSFSSPACFRRRTRACAWRKGMLSACFHTRACQELDFFLIREWPEVTFLSDPSV